jgi:hypothetical protein
MELGLTHASRKTLSPPPGAWCCLSLNCLHVWKRFSDDAVLPQERLLIARHPAENLRLPVQRLDEVVNIKIHAIM